MTTAQEIIALAKRRKISVSRLLRELRGEPELTREEALIAYGTGEITEGRLAESLNVDRLTARQIVQEQG
jgi:hypothetical protein